MLIAIKVHSWVRRLMLLAALVQLTACPIGPPPNNNGSDASASGTRFDSRTNLVRRDQDMRIQQSTTDGSTDGSTDSIITNTNASLSGSCEHDTTATNTYKGSLTFNREEKTIEASADHDFVFVRMYYFLDGKHKLADHKHFDDADVSFGAGGLGTYWRWTVGDDILDRVSKFAFRGKYSDIRTVSDWTTISVEANASSVSCGSPSEGETAPFPP